jgi:hypothetical protein
MEPRREPSAAWTGWIGFAAITLGLIGAINFFEGLVAIIRDEYYVLTPNQILLFDMTTWGWLMLLWGILLFLASLALAAGAGWARWFTIVIVSINLIGQLGWLGASQYPLWSLVVIGLEIIVLFALTVRWGRMDIEA